MLIKKKPGWEIPESAVTPELVYADRRRFIQTAAVGSLLAAAPFPVWGKENTPEAPSAHRYPVERNPKYTVEREMTAQKAAETYNNFYEFGSHKEISKAAQELKIDPWTVTIDGMVEKPFQIGIDELLDKMPLEERVYRHRCVEAWAMTVPWSGFPLRSLVDLAKPMSGAKYLQMQTFGEKGMAPGLRQFWYPWPYTEGLTMAEARNDLAFIATGLYGKPIPKQNGAPLRLAVPWKYGFKSLKSIVRFTFTDKRPVTFWEKIGPKEYGFWANVNPDVKHPRWSQATERLLGSEERVPTRIYNGYEEFVADIYTGIKGQKLFM
ncbi:MAG: protein-methionine-sulfoxide reductase catalytic subunit MsrP [Rhodospirillaceae bacterium]|jgi:methionine sulfoxide reductase catalytic subunit|nr:protein-methionine-sulfoxide reductase catalytic subunit MsrP [Rhodospirillaceae bacterium]MBT5659683.1 protein-methionine-sulfoxide reductase catalytic subunit MsrP [Rhodospirillaceae bacterium]MBT5753107.1 protein-methionine-sulfoxide reductase catalytic subunit MsrP [Rhodospirillaceae bacterium]